MDTNQFDYQSAFGVNFSQSKADRLRYHQSLMTHAMVFTAFDGPQECPTRWRVENSWGDKNNKGYGLMTDAWFNEFMYQIVVEKDILSEEHQKNLQESPVCFS
jgi:bleomycin hydrolase